MVLRQGLKLVLAGIALGLAGGAGLIRAIGAIYEKTDAKLFDLWGFVAVPMALFAITMLACYIPARSAAAIDPNQALRYE